MRWRTWECSQHAIHFVLDRTHELFNAGAASHYYRKTVDCIWTLSSGLYVNAHLGPVGTQDQCGALKRGRHTEQVRFTRQGIQTASYHRETACLNNGSVRVCVCSFVCVCA